MPFDLAQSEFIYFKRNRWKPITFVFAFTQSEHSLTGYQWQLFSYDRFFCSKTLEEIYYDSS